jgi:predicted DNA-binding ribbon-helix-helix protein
MTENSPTPVTKIKRNVTIDKRRTTLMLEQEIWNILDELAREEGLTLDELCQKIYLAHQGDESISSVIRIIAVLACRVLSPETKQQNPLELQSPQMLFPSRFHQALGKLNP